VECQSWDFSEVGLSCDNKKIGEFCFSKVPQNFIDSDKFVLGWWLGWPRPSFPVMPRSIDLKGFYEILWFQFPEVVKEIERVISFISRAILGA